MIYLDHEGTPAWHDKRDINMHSEPSASGSVDQYDHQIIEEQIKIGRTRTARPLQVAAGSRLPDCSHACGSCSPCRLVVVSYMCSSLTQSETCPISYKCVCNNKSYPVP